SRRTCTSSATSSTTAPNGSGSRWPASSDPSGRGAPDEPMTQAPQLRGTATPPSLLTDQDLHLFNGGTHLGLADRLGAHPGVFDGIEGTFFGVWAPNAEAVSVIGDFNGWRPARDSLRPRGTSGLWEGFVPGVRRGARYKYHVMSRIGG